MCACGSEVETTEHFLLCCHPYSAQRLQLFEDLEKVGSIFFNLNVKVKSVFYYMVLYQQLPKVLITIFLNL